ncbi:glycosyl hydrolase [Paracrocinitomix mangrovi]|uniref:WD40/YVTN/BNR-like repeat-containing protein n=1 Tax=Paracrocinitomix mangrovi TaxID=2862509 RepID=UPI001C8E238F|nr:glycosyl hydrolase [Paracrocinitomix mangrovi]UKN03256.1 glycosyl hydrolase [Paracrocinitomix mangrovi]
MRYLSFALIFFSTILSIAQETSYSQISNALEFRCIGPFRGGRSAAVTGVPGKPMTFYMGSTGGGVWKTENGGNSWKNISDGYFGGSIGSIAVSKSNNSVLYVGGGEVTVRGNVSYGYGMYKSVNGGRSWTHIGLEKSRHIPRICIDPFNPEIVYAAVLGDLYKSTEERGVYKSVDGGKNWNKVLFSNKDAGAVDLVMDPEDPNILYASTWNVRRSPYDFSSGGEGSALWKTTDGGENWTEISKNEGFPEGTLGIIGISVSPVNPERVWSIVEAKEGGVYKSDDGAKTWTKTNDDRNLRQRAWYYSRIYADTKDEDKVYVMNVAYHVSSDGGKTFNQHYAPHGDHHDLWIAPEDPQRMIIGDDGGAQITFDGGNNWSTYHNQPTAQFYRVTTDNSFPYRVYGAQQDNSTIRIRHRVSGGQIGRGAWEATAGGESAHIAVDPENDDIVYGGSYGGFLTRKNHDNDQNRSINVWPDNPIGYGAEGMKYRFQWNFPVFFSPHDSKKLYAASNHLHVSTNGGESWKVISPDLTRNDTSKLGPSGGPITKDNTGVEYYCTIFAAVESPYEKDLLWTGSDDGLIQRSTDGGNGWVNVTPSDLPEWSMINSIEVDPFNKGGLYVAATSYKMGDYKPYLYHTKDYGKSWEKIVNGIEEEHFTRVIRADPKRQGLLYAGTESGLYISIDDGKKWEKFQQNLPIVPITDLHIKDNDLIVATQGRSFWILDDLHLIHQYLDKKPWDLHLYKPENAYALRGSSKTSNTAGTNHSGGVRVHYYLEKEVEKEDTIQLEFLDPENKVIRSFSNYPNSDEGKLEVKKGTNLFVWDMKYPKADDFEGLLLWWGTLEGPMAPPGTYGVQIKKNGKAYGFTQKFDIIRDPRSEGTDQDLRDKFKFLLGIRNKLDETHKVIKHMRLIKQQIAKMNELVGDDKSKEDVIQKGNDLENILTEIEGQLYQTKLKSNQDMLNYPIMLNNKLAHIASLAKMSNDRPTEQMYAVAKELTDQIDLLLKEWYKILNEEIPAYNALIRSKEINVIGIPKEK